MNRNEANQPEMKVDRKKKEGLMVKSKDKMRNKDTIGRPVDNRVVWVLPYH